MARIRSIKPQFFRHRRLFIAEQESGLPLRVAFAGLWTCADREGRFRWEPDELKLDCLPYDEVDFARVMHALFTRGFIVRYASSGREYGFIPGFLDHQIVNNREAASVIPEPPENLSDLIEGAREVDASSTRDPRDTIQIEGKGKGREQEGKGTEIGTRRETRPRNNDFEVFWNSYPRRQGANPKAPAEKLFLAAVKAGADPLQMIHGARLCAAMESGKIGTEFIPQAVKWLRDRRWEDYLSAEAGKTAAADDGMIEIINEHQLAAWDAYAASKGAKSFPRNSRGGWRFPSRWPPGYVPPQDSFEPPPAPLRRIDA